MPPPRAPWRAVPYGWPLLRVLLPAIPLAFLALLSPELSGAAVVLVAAPVWRRHHP
jgi:hypothetical protein